MIWFTWRQFRTQALTIAAGLLAFLVALVSTWTKVTDAARDAGFTGCRADACGRAAAAFLASLPDETTGLYVTGATIFLVLPVVLGVFWGAPLVARELETGTYRLVFSQSVSRRRWLLVKLAFGAGAAALAAGPTSLVLTWWSEPIDHAQNRFATLIFQARGIVPIAYAVLAFVIGVAVGLVLRRTVAAMAVTLLVVVALLAVAPPVLLRTLIRPDVSITAWDAAAGGPLGRTVDRSTGKAHLDVGGDDMQRLGIRLSDGADSRQPGDYILSTTVVTPTGAEFTGPLDPAACEGPAVKPASGPPDSSDPCRAWLATQHLRLKSEFVPDSRFWVLQWREAGLVAGLALGVAAFCLWLIRRRLT